jgi:hypothetical protein
VWPFLCEACWAHSCFFGELKSSWYTDIVGWTHNVDNWKTVSQWFIYISATCLSSFIRTAQIFEYNTGRISKTRVYHALHFISLHLCFFGQNVSHCSPRLKGYLTRSSSGWEGTFLWSVLKSTNILLSFLFTRFLLPWVTNWVHDIYYLTSSA